MTHPHPSEAVGLFDIHADHHHAVVSATASCAALMDAADHRVIDLHLTAQQCTFSVHHRHIETLSHRPRHSQRALQSPGRQTFLGRGQMPRSLEPCRQRGACLVEDRARDYRRLMTAGRAYQTITALVPRSRNPLARWTDDFFLQVQLFQNPYAFDSGGASAWRVNGGFRLEIPRSI